MWISGSRNARVVIYFSKVSSKVGNKIRFENMANNKVRETSIPRACVPPNSDAEKIENPKNKIIKGNTNKLCLKYQDICRYVFNEKCNVVFPF